MDNREGRGESKMNSLKELLEIKKTIKKKRPNFIRQDAFKRKRLSMNWRAPAGGPCGPAGTRFIPRRGSGTARRCGGTLKNAQRPVPSRPPPPRYRGALARRLRSRRPVAAICDEHAARGLRGTNPANRPSRDGAGARLDGRGRPCARGAAGSNHPP